MKRLLQSFLFLILLQAAFAAETRTFIGKAERISDGDTIKFTITEGTSIGTSMTVRLAGLDAPEISHRKGQEGQPFGAESMANLRRLIEGKPISLHQLDKDRYGRLVGLIYVGSNNVNLLQVSGGFAEVYREYLKTVPLPIRDQFIEAERTAKAKRLGIWSLPSYERPSDFRKRKKY